MNKMIIIVDLCNKQTLRFINR